MIYLFDRAKKLQKIIPRKHIINANPTVVRNGIYQLAVEVPIFYEDKKGTQYNYQKSVGKATFAGHYDDKNRFQLYKIYSRNITANNQGEFLLFDGVHIFFDEAKAMGNIHDRRFRDSEAKAPADAAFNSIGWTVIDYDVTDRHDINFYRASVTDAWNDLISTYGVEFDYELQFDGRKIISKNIIMKKQIGQWTGQRFAYGTNVMTLTQEQDESEVYTAAVGRGRGEEAGDGFGPRLEFGDIAWSKDGITKPIGQNYIELPSATAEYGFIENGVVKPRIAPEVIFEDIEDKKKLADATYYWLLENCLPKATWKTDVARIGNLELGDTVGVLYKAAGIIKRARVEKIEYNLLDPELSKLTLGDFHHFENRQMKRINAQIKRLGRDNRSLITQVKDGFDQQFNAWVTAFRNEFEQAKIDIFAEIEADRVNMEALLNTKLTDFNTEFNADMDEAYEEAQRNYTAIEEYVNTTVETNRGQVEQIINTAEQSAKDYAAQQAIEKANTVQTNLDAVTGSHAGMLQALENSVLDIDTFLGDARDVTLDELFIESTLNMEERIRNININTYNMLQGTRFDESGKYSNAGGTSVLTTEDINRMRISDIGNNTSSFLFADSVRIEANTNYWLVVDYFSFTTPELDYMQLQLEDGTYQALRNADTGEEGFMNLQTDGNWRKAVIRINSPITLEGRLRMGSRWNVGAAGVWIDVRQPYLTNTSNREWLPHPNDATQSIEMITRRMTELEDGYSDFITKSQYDLETGSLNQYIRSVEQNVEGNELVLQRVEDWQSTNGQSVLESVDAYQRKLWLNDFAEIGANMIPQSLSAFTDGRYWSSGTHSDYPQDIRLKREQAIVIGTGVQVTFSDSSTADSGISHWLINMVDWTNQTTHGEQLMVSRGQKITFFTQSTRVLLSAVAVEGSIISQNTIEQPNKRIFAKLEVGASATPMLNAISHIEQLANKISMQVQDLDGDYLSQSDIEIRPGYVQLGSQRLGDNQLASIFRVSPNSIDAITERMVLNGDLYVDGDITALAVTAIKAEFADLFAARVKAGTVHADYVEGFTARFESLYTLNANIERLVAQTVFTDAITAKSVDAIVANIGRVRTALLTANVIESDHIQVGTALVGKMFATSARIDELITKSHFVTNVKAMSIEAVEGQFSTLFTRYLSANYIDVDYINGKNAWFESLYTQNAMIAKLTAQTAFIRDIQAIEITANQLNIQTLQSKLAGTEGGLTIYGPDGRVLINNSVLRASFDVQLFDFYAGSLADFNGSNYYTTSSFWQTIKYFYTDFKGSQLLVSWAISLQTGESASEYAEVQVRGFGGNNPIGTRPSRQFVSAGETSYHNQIIDLGVPDYSTIQAYLEIRRSPGGSNSRNRITARILRVSMIN